MTDKKRGTLVWSTGISGCNRKEHLSRLAKLAEVNGKKIKIYNVGEMIFDEAEVNSVHLTSAKVLDTPHYTLDSLRAAVFQKILAQIEKDLAENDIVIINLHTVFLWKDGPRMAYNIQYLKKFNPDMFVCFIDSADTILESLLKREQWQNQHLTEQLVWLWQHCEVNNTENYRFLFGKKPKPFFVVPVTQPEETLYYLALEPWRPRVYAQMPISHLAEEELKAVREFIKWLWNYFVIFDPLTIDIKRTKAVTADDQRARNNQTVIRDRYWHIGQSEICIAYIAKLVFTAGVIDETREAQDTNKDIYWIFPKD
ncbi:MAG: AAA family ATPase, partial [Candidatus Falkowbacteria bacterium]